MSFFATLKRNGKQALSGNWNAAVGTGALVALIGLVLTALEYAAVRLFIVTPLQSNPTMEPQTFDLARLVRELFVYSRGELLLTAGFTLLGLLLLSPLRLGLTRWYYLLVQGTQRPRFGELFHFFENLRRYAKAVWLQVQLTCRAFFWGLLLFFLPCGIFGISIWFLRTPGIDRATRSAASGGLVVSCAMLLLAALLLNILLNKYALVAYLLCDNEQLGVGAAFRTSIRYTRGYRNVLLLFSLSFVGWFLLAPLTLLLLLGFLGPYHGASRLLLCRYLVEKNRLGEPQVTQEWHPVRQGRPPGIGAPGQGGRPAGP